MPHVKEYFVSLLQPIWRLDCCVVPNLDQNALRSATSSLSVKRSMENHVRFVFLQQHLLRKAEKAPKTTNRFERKSDSSARSFRARASFYASVLLSTMALIQSAREKFDKCCKNLYICINVYYNVSAIECNIIIECAIILKTICYFSTYYYCLVDPCTLNFTWSPKFPCSTN